MSHQLYLYYDGDYVGRIDDFTTDMWYMEGKWIPADGEAAAHFNELFAAEDVKTNFSKGKGLLVKYAEQREGVLLDGLALGILDQNAVIRMLSRESADALRKKKYS